MQAEWKIGYLSTNWAIGYLVNEQTWTTKNPKMCKKWLFNTEMVMYLIWS